MNWFQWLGWILLGVVAFLFWTGMAYNSGKSTATEELKKKYNIKD